MTAASAMPCAPRRARQTESGYPVHGPAWLRMFDLMAGSAKAME